MHITECFLRAMKLYSIAHPPQNEAIAHICSLHTSESCNDVLFHGNLTMITGTEIHG
jgi:hypothetical protein